MGEEPVPQEPEGKEKAEAKARSAAKRKGTEDTGRAEEARSTEAGRDRGSAYPFSIGLKSLQLRVLAMSPAVSQARRAVATA